MALTSRTAYRLGGFTIDDEDIDKDANIEISKLGTRTLYKSIPATSCHRSGAGAVNTIQGVFSGVVMPDANTSFLFFTLPKPDEYIGGNLTVRILWSCAPVANNLKLEVNMASYNEGDAITALDTQTNTDAAAGTTLLLNEIAVVFSEAIADAGDFWSFRIFRNPLDAADTLAADIIAYAISFEFVGRG